MKEELKKLLESVYGKSVSVKSTSRTGGGCINETQVLILSNGERVFLKYNSNPPKNFFRTEARGLRLLGSAKDGPKVPQPLGEDPAPDARFILMEYVESASPGKVFDVRFAEALANLHRTTDGEHGLDHDNFIGKTEQKNTREKDGVVFFRDRRLRFQQELARKTGKLPSSTDRKLDTLCDKLENLLDVTREKPALMHGDLWSGNHFCGPGGAPCIVDPAVYYGLREADLAMTELFGRLPQTFYDAYHRAFPMNPGYEERKQIFNLYHLLNHLNLFGRSYLSSVEQTVRYFTG
ncbi:MAG: fructosamine kinase family protein [Nitrospinaceae bacterium]